MPVACLCVRSVDAGEKRLVLDVGIDVLDMRFIDEVGMGRTMEMALADLDTDTHLHVSFDVDFLDPGIAPGVTTTVPGGPTYRERCRPSATRSSLSAGRATRRGSLHGTLVP